MITISGLPCAGKTTLINKLCKQFPNLYRVNEYQRTLSGAVDWGKYIAGNIDIVTYQKRMIDYVVAEIAKKPKNKTILVDKNPWYGVDVYCKYDLNRKLLTKEQFDEISNYYAKFFPRPTKIEEITEDVNFEKYLDGFDHDLILRTNTELINERMCKRGDPGEWDYYFSMGNFSHIAELDAKWN